MRQEILRKSCGDLIKGGIMKSLKQMSIPLFTFMISGLVGLVMVRIKPELFLRADDLESASDLKQEFSDDIAQRHNRIQRDFDNFFKENILGQEDPFAEMRKMRQKMFESTERFRGDTATESSPFDSWFSGRFCGSIDDIERGEDADFIYYHIKVNNLESTSVTTQVENGMVTVTGSIERSEYRTNDGDKKSSDD